MKKRYLLPLIIMAMCMGFSAKAAVGDVCGDIYTTDIGAYIDDMPIKSYNIGGKTAVVVESLREYGFSVEWREQERLLIAKTGYMPENLPSYTQKAEAPGNIAGKIYETDIKVIFNGIEVPSFNIGGLTAVAIEDMGNLTGGRYSYDGNAHRGMDKPYTDIGMYHIWNPDAKTISLYTLRPGSTVKTEFGEVVIDAKDDSVERINYLKSAKSLGAMDGRYYATYTDGLEIDGKLYVMLYDIIEIFGGRADASGDVLNIRTNVQNAMQLRYEDSLDPQSCQNILYPLCQKLSVNDNPANSGYADFYLYKNEVFVSADSLNKAAGKALLRDIGDLPSDSINSRGKILFKDHILFINGRAVDSYLASNGEYYIPVDELAQVKFDIISSFEMRNLKTPEELPEIVSDEENYPGSYFLSDTDGKGYMCEVYDGVHNVKIDDKAISCVYIHFPYTYLTPCISLDELVEAAGYFMEKSGDAIRVYTRKDRLTIGVDAEISNILIYKGNRIEKIFPIEKYQYAGVFNDYLYLEMSGDMAGTNEIYRTDTFEKIAEVQGTILEIKDGRIFTYENITVNGELARRYFIYDMTGKLIETYVDGK